MDALLLFAAAGMHAPAVKSAQASSFTSEVSRHQATGQLADSRTTDARHRAAAARCRQCKFETGRLQRGTNHAWSNRTDKPVLMLYVLIDGKFDDELKGYFGNGGH